MSSLGKGLIYLDCNGNQGIPQSKMTIVTDKKYFMEPSILGKLDLMCKRCSGKYQHQNLIITDGIEGYGKTTLTGCCAYYMGYMLERPVKLFFDCEKLMKYAINSEDEILIWDDAAYAGLTIEAYNRIIIKLIKTIWLARKKRHTYFINMQEVFRLKELIVSRALALMHVYSPDEIRLGKAVYFNRNAKDLLYEGWQRRKKKQYKKFYTFRFTFPNAFYKIFDEEEYNELKDAAIQNIEKEEQKKKDATIELKMMKFKYATLPLRTKDLAKHAEVTDRSIQMWRKYLQELPMVRYEVGKPNAIHVKGYIEPTSNKIPLVLPTTPNIRRVYPL